MTSIETTNVAKNEMKVMVPMDLAALCKKLADNPATTEEMRAKFREFVAQYNLLAPVRGKGNATQHFEGELMIEQITRFLPSVLDIRSHPESEPNDQAVA